jgi:hypothetical protein
MLSAVSGPFIITYLSTKYGMLASYNQTDNWLCIKWC